jgi:transposase
MELTNSLKTLFIETANTLTGSARRLFMARTVKELGPGGQRRAERDLGWNRETMRKGTRELESGLRCLDNFAARGRKRAEVHLPNLLTDIAAIVDAQSQADPQFRTNRLYTRLDAAEVRRQLIAQKGYTDAALPTVQTITTKLKPAGLLSPKGCQERTEKKILETDAIFEQVNQMNAAADATPDVLRISIDAKATVKVGPFARGGQSRATTKACDHDFKPAATVTPVGILLPATDEVFIYHLTSKVTSDGLVDRLIQWWEAVHSRFAHITTLVINLDNGPENHSRRTQFMQRIVAFAHQYGLRVRLAYYPPYHSKYNPIERCWGILEHHWNGSILDTVDAVLNYTATMTWRGLHPVVELVTTVYQTGVRLTKAAMAEIEAQIARQPGLDKWFVDILPNAGRDD